MAHWQPEPDVVLALMSGQPAHAYLDTQREARLKAMHELTEARRSAPARERLLLDYQLFHIEADLRWIGHVSAQLGNLTGQREIEL